MTYSPEDFEDNFVIVDPQEVNDLVLSEGHEYALFGVDSVDEMYDENGGFYSDESDNPMFWEIGDLLATRRNDGSIALLRELREKGAGENREVSLTDLESLERYAEENEIEITESSGI